MTVGLLKEILGGFPDDYQIVPSDYDVYLDQDNIQFFKNKKYKVVYYGYMTRSDIEYMSE